MKRTAFPISLWKCTACWVSFSLFTLAWITFAQAADGTIPRGMAVAQACVVCHGPEGQSTGAIPSLKGMPAQKLRAAMVEYRTGERSGTVMNRLARGLENDDIEAVAQYFSALRQR